MSSEGNLHVVNRHSKPNPFVERLAVPVGTWNLQVYMAADQPPIPGQSIIMWRPGDYFLEVRTSVERDNFPTGHMLIGGDSDLGAYTVLYYDSRGVARIYQMSLGGGVWKMWRDAPNFPQRFTATLRDDGRVIDAQWEKINQGSDWEVDFPLTYTKSR